MRAVMVEYVDGEEQLADADEGARTDDVGLHRKRGTSATRSAHVPEQRS